MRHFREDHVNDRKRIFTATSVILVAGLALAACGSSSSPSSTSSSKQTSSLKSSSKKTKSSAASTVGQVSRCRSANLVAHMVSTQGAAGSIIRTYTLVNTGSSSCTLYGYPGLQLLGASGQKLPTEVLRTPAAEATVKLAHDASAAFSLKYADSTGYGSESCPSSASLEITPPNAYHSLTVTGAAGVIDAFGGTTQALKCGILNVEPVAADQG
ncbi:DUF4232 domain-containing protein [Ferrimicrobium acidiphilum]|uniref:DUF4232 domain-containing protein n=1 Tax=Ferrimicrobium acidiphilum TaxID=121039 RepID=UPI0023F289B0|nr:DUF4232 domain-containing protein [Ferrimicrobium acidiphilum]